MIYIISGLLILLLIGAFLPNIYATGIPIEPQTIFGRLDDTKVSKQSIKTGETMTISGNITSMTPKNLTGWFMIQSAPGPIGRLEIENDSAKMMINIPAFSRIPYSLTIKALQPGIYHLSPLLHIIETNRIFSISTDSNLEPVITVRGNPICSHGFVSIIKVDDGSSACVTPDTANILVERGWGHLP